MSTRYDELTKILGTGSAGTPSSTPAADDSKPLSRQDEIYSILGGSASAPPATADTGTSTTQSIPALEKPKQETLQQTTPQPAAQTAPLTQGSAAGGGGSAAGGGGGRGGMEDARANLQRQLNALDEAAAYVTTTEQSDAIEQQRRPIIEQLRQMDEEEGRTGVYTGGDRLKNLFSNARLATQQGLTKADHRIAQTADWLFGGIAKEGRALLNTTLQSINPNWGFENEDPLITQYNKRGEDVIAHNEAVAQKRIEEGRLSPTAWKYAPEVVAAIPDAVLAYFTAGASSGAQATSAGLEAASAAAQAGKAAQTIVPIANATKNMIKNPAWASAFAQTAGSSYEQALAEGATEEEANLYALLNGFANATIEVGGSDEALGGIQKLPQQLRDALEKGNNTAVMRWIKSTVNEAGEEVAQGMAEKAMRGIYTNDVPLYSAADENAVINPTRAKEEALGGLVVGGLLGGGQSLLQSAINENRQSARSAQTAGQEQTGAEAQAEEMSDTEATPQSAAPTAPLTGDPLRAATQGRPYSQPGQGPELNTRQEAQTQAAEAAQDAQRSTLQAETPPTTQNAAQAASDALNRQAEMNAQEQETTAAQNAATAAYNQTTGQRERAEGADAVRGFSENVATDSAMEEALRREFEQNPEMYTRLANKDTLKKAQDIFTQGLDKARSELERAIGAAQSGQKLSPEMVPLSRMVANELTRQGELTAARKIISDVAAELTSAGQLGQAGAILRNADPMTVLNTLQKAIDAINAEVGKKFGKRNPWKAELTAEEIKQISETDFSQDGAFEAIQQQIAKRLGREMPATVAEKFRELRKVGMLANPKTQLKNLLGNAPLAVERKVAQRLSGGIQELAVKAGIMSKEEQTRTLRVSKESKDLAKSVYKNNIDRITKKGNKGELRGILRNTRTYFNKGLLQKGIEKATGHQLNDAALDYVRRFTYDMLEKGDAPFVKSAFIDSLAQYCEAQGIKSEADVTETAFSYALDQAMAATFKDASALANLLNGIKDKAGIAGQALDVLLPFTTTPINMAKEFGKYSPLGYLQLLNAKGKGTAEVIDIISRATTGSAVVAIGAILRSLGFITGAADDDKDKAAHDKAIGISPYSVLGKYSYEWAQPTGSALAMGASIYDAAKDGGSLIEILSNGLIAAGDAYLEQSFFNDIIDLFQGYGSPSENLLTELLKSLVSQSMPSIVGAAARTIDPTVRTSYSGGNALDDALTALGIKTPFASKGMAASVDVRGEEVQRGNLGQRILDNFILPFTTNRNSGNANAVDKALDEVYEATGDKTIFRQVSPYKVDYGKESYQMTGEEREQFQKTQGQVHDDILQQIIDGGQWKSLSNKEKAKIMNRVNEYALDSAKRELVESRGDDYSSDWDDEAALNDTGSYFVAKIKADKDGNGRISQEELWYYLGLQKNMPEETKDVLWDILTTGKTGYAQYAEKQK